MATQVYVFGGGPAQPSMVSFNALALDADTALAWPWVDQDTSAAVPLWLDVTPSGAFPITMPDATGAPNGQAVIIFNVGSSTITILDSTGMSITTVTTGVAKYIILRDNSTAAGFWRVTVMGAGTSSADAGSLAGAGLSALAGATLNSNIPVVAVVSDTNITTASRAQIYEITSATGAGTLSFDPVSTLGDGFWIGFTNQGTGAWNIDPNGSELIDSQTTISANPTEAFLVFCSGGALYTVGRGRSQDFVYTALNKNVAGSSNVTLTSTEASSLLIKLFGVLTGNINVIVPSVVNEYMINNATSGGFTITVKTAAGTGVTAPQGEQIILKCDGTDVLSAFTVIPTSTTGMSDGSESAPGLSFTLEPSTGFYRPSAGVMGLSILASQVFGYSATLNTSYLPLTVVGALTATGLAVSGATPTSTITATDAGATVAPVLTLYRNSASPAAADIIGGLNADGKDSGANQTTYASLQATILDPTNGSEDGAWNFWTTVAGTLAKRGFMAQGLVIGAGTDGGAGTITTTGAIIAGGPISGTTGAFTGAVTVSNAATGALMTVTSTDATATAGPTLDLYRNSASPAAADSIGAIQINGQNSTPAKIVYALLSTQILDATAASEDSIVTLSARSAGALTGISVSNGVIIGAPTGTFKGNGTLNVEGLYVAGVAVTPASSGVLVAHYHAELTAYTTCSTTIPYDDTAPPVVTEGTQVLSRTAVTTSATQILDIRVSLNIYQNGGNYGWTVWRDGTTLVGSAFGTTNGVAPNMAMTIELQDSPAGAATYTYTVRAGGSAGSIYINGTAGGRIGGGSQRGATIDIDVIEP